MATSIHAEMKNILQDLIPTLAGWCLLIIIMPAKVGIKSCRCTGECFSFLHGWK